MSTATLTSKGQITIPKAIRNFLKLNAGDEVDFVIDKSGQVRLAPATLDVSELKGILRKPKNRAVSLDDMDAGIAHHLKKKYKP